MKGYPTRFVVFDTETFEETDRQFPNVKNLRLRLGVAIICDTISVQGSRWTTVHFNTSEEFHHALSNMPLHRDPIHIYAHNIGFDVRAVEFFRRVSLGTYSLLPPMSVSGYGRYKHPLFIADSPPFLVRLWRSDGQQFLLIDTYQWAQKSLATIGDEIGRPKGRMPPQDASDQEWAEYCQTDCEVLLRAVERIWEFLKSLRLPDFCPTPASQAMSMYRMRYEKKRIIRPEDKTCLSLDAMGYYGGQVEAFRLGLHDQTTFQVDVSSLYPFVMMDNLYPCAVESYHDDPTPCEPGPKFDPRCTTAEVYLESPDWPYPVRGRDETLWVNGKVRTVLCGPELERAWVMGHIKFVGRYTRFLMEDLFSEFVSCLWDKRDTARRGGDSFVASLCKLMMNSLHGKFGQKTGEWAHHGRQYDKSVYGTGKCVGEAIEHDTDYRVLAGHLYMRTHDQYDERSFVPIAAWTSSYARCFMHDARYVAGDANVLYQATDSLLINGEGLGQLEMTGLLQENRLGSFRHEETYPWAIVYGPNSVDLGAKRKRPGVSSKALEIAPETYQVEEWSSLLEDLSRGNVSSISIETTSKHIRHGYTRRFVNPDGTTKPHSVSNWEIPPEDQAKRPIALSLTERI